MYVLLCYFELFFEILCQFEVPRGERINCKIFSVALSFTELITTANVSYSDFVLLSHILFDLPAYYTK